MSDDFSHPDSAAGVPSITESTERPIEGDTRGRVRPRTGTNPASNLVVFRSSVTQDQRRDTVRERLNHVIRPLLRAYAKGLRRPFSHLEAHIEGDRPLTASPILTELRGAFHWAPVRETIAEYADPTLVSAEVRAGLATMLAQDLSGEPPTSVRQAFTDWNKPLVATGYFLTPWRPTDAARWLREFPPFRTLLEPMDMWDDRTAAIWLNDRSPLTFKSLFPVIEDNVVPFEPRAIWKPSTEVLGGLDELDLEALSHRVFRERFRRDIMPPVLSARRARIRNAIEAMSYGYLTLEEARLDVHTYDLERQGYFDRLFGSNDEWIFDLGVTIASGYTLPQGFDRISLTDSFGHLDSRA